MYERRVAPSLVGAEHRTHAPPDGVHGESITEGPPKDSKSRVHRAIETLQHSNLTDQHTDAFNIVLDALDDPERGIGILREIIDLIRNQPPGAEAMKQFVQLLDECRHEKALVVLEAEGMFDIASGTKSVFLRYADGDPEAYFMLNFLTLMGSNDTNIRTLRALSGTKNEVLVQLLDQTFLNRDKDPSVRIEAARSLSACNRSWIKDQFAKVVLDSSENPKVREEIAWALREIWTKEDAKKERFATIMKSHRQTIVEMFTPNTPQGIEARARLSEAQRIGLFFSKVEIWVSSGIASLFSRKSDALQLRTLAAISLLDPPNHNELNREISNQAKAFLLRISKAPGYGDLCELANTALARIEKS